MEVRIGGVNMNKVYKKGGKTPLTSQELAVAANAITRSKPFTASMFEGETSRISGSGHCACNGNGEFELLPLYDSAVQEGQKRYMICRNCGCVSHL